MQLAKKNLRKKIKEEVQLLSAEVRQQKSQEVSEKVFKFLKETGTDSCVIGGYAPMHDEAIWYLGPMQSLESHFAFPTAKDSHLIFKKCSLMDLKEGQEFGVSLKIPPESALEVSPAVLLVPALAYSKEGKRLGRGKGYYDRYLKNFKGVTVGICFEEQIAQDIATEEHDQMVQNIITDKSIINIKG
ncbi:MAG: 5-formyltetrahydrofolate cyclo-ligase [Bacteriovoracaceae bacterium]|nr:5-formyltetrahydrofolate cyclo-ligase [Bacteriovoracaceae bacterium]